MSKQLGKEPTRAEIQEVMRLMRKQPRIARPNTGRPYRVTRNKGETK